MKLGIHSLWTWIGGLALAAGAAQAIPATRSASTVHLRVVVIELIPIPSSIEMLGPTPRTPGRSYQSGPECDNGRASVHPGTVGPPTFPVRPAGRPQSRYPTPGGTMIRTPLTWLVGALAAAVLAAGCGSSSSTSSSTAGSAPAAATTPAATTTPATASTPAGAPGGASAAGVAQAVA